MRILVVGAGATGGLFGARLAHAGRDVTFLVRPKRAAQLRASGLQVVSPLGDFSIAPQLVESGAIGGTYDLILLGLKAYQLADAIADFAPAVGPETTILPMLNGMKHLDTLTQRFGEAPVLGGVCLVSSTLDDAGRIVQLHEAQALIYGERDGNAGARANAVDTALKDAGFGTTLSQHILRDMWEKWRFLATLAASNVLMRGNIEQLVHAGGAPTIAAIFNECTAIAKAWTYELTDGLVGNALERLTSPGLPLTASMYRDMLGGARVEADHILGDLVARGEELGVAVPLLRAAYTQLNVYQRSLA
jgi:2-dehydropantoate 2-reductase